MADVRLTTPRLRVILGDDTAVEVQVINADLVRFDMTRNQHKWPDAESAPMLWLTFVSCVALKRTHTIPEATTWEAYRDSTQRSKTSQMTRAALTQTWWTLPSWQQSQADRVHCPGHADGSQRLVGRA